VRSDGRNIDQALGILAGEGSHQRVSGRLEQAAPEPREDSESYYGLALLKEPVWKASIPAYFYVGGLAGASAALAGALQARGPSMASLVRKGRVIALGGAIVSGALLIEDLGIRERFIYMMRVFRPSSPMNVGTWILTAFGGAATAAMLPGTAGNIAGAVSGVMGLPLAGYTGVLLANTAVPLWAMGRTTLPPLFVASAAVSAASVFEMLSETGRERRVVARLSILSKLSELATHLVFERTAGRVPQVAKPLHQGVTGALWKASRIGVAASLAISLWPKAPRAVRVIGGALGTLGALATRFGVFHAGKASARDPHATFDWQRA
jgi:formate-dependent nitrite reductase membrane component NrfD